MTLKTLETYFSNKTLPDSIQLDECAYITDVKEFVRVSIETLKANPKNRTFLPYYERLLKLKNLIQ